MADRAALWTPHVTVAAVVEREGRFLLVDEETDQGRLYNQPAGHWDPGETLLEAVVRETREETGLRFTPRSLVAIHHWHDPSNDFTYLRFSFAGDVEGDESARSVEPSIYGLVWMTVDEIRAANDRMRGPQVLACVENHLGGRRVPLDLIERLG
ncbi:MAG: NUDIX hydrolase [Candidatus Binatia bacterium]